MFAELGRINIMVVVHTRNVEECKLCMDSVLFNSDSLFKIASYLPADGLLNLALTSRRFGIGGDSSLSLVEETTRRIVQDIATEEEMAALPDYDEGDNNWLSKYNYLQSLRVPLTFDQLVGPIDYVEGNKSRVVCKGGWVTAFSNNIMMTGKHYVSFETCNPTRWLLLGMTRFPLWVGVIRPGEAMQNASEPSFYENFTERNGNRQYNNRINCCVYFGRDGGKCYSHNWGECNPVNCCMYYTSDGRCYSHDRESNCGFSKKNWDGMKRIPSPSKIEIGMLLDLDEGTLSVYSNGRKLGVMKRGLAGHYCWVVATNAAFTQVTIKRGTVPERGLRELSDN